MSLPLYKHNDEEPILRRIDITDYVHTFLLELEAIDKTRTRLNSEFEIMRVKALLDNPDRTTLKSIQPLGNGRYGWNWQEVAFVKSNLGPRRGGLFYFVCNGCQEKVKYLYEQSSVRSPVCRACSRIKYARRSRRKQHREHKGPFHVGGLVM